MTADVPGFHAVANLADEHDRVTIGNLMHEMHAKRLAENMHILKLVQVILTTLTTCSAGVVILGETHTAAIITGILATLALAVELAQLRFDLASEIKRHNETAFALWSLREHYRRLHSDVLDGSISATMLRDHTQALFSEKQTIIRNAPPCSPKYYAHARTEAKTRLLQADKS